MSWIQALYDTYNVLEQDKDNFAIRELLKVGHSTQKAHVEITLDRDGTFKHADFVDNTKAKTVIPVTESSASRSSGVAPHPLFDKLKYLAKDYDVYTGEENEKQYQAYMEQLEGWCASPYGDDRIQRVFEYLTKGTIIHDLIQAGIFSVEENHQLTSKWENADGYKLSPGNQKDAFIRFRVRGTGKQEALWQDPGLHDQYVQYYLSDEADHDLCYVMGKDARSCVNHPSKIRNSGDKAKLISANDKTNFTYRGLFGSAEEAYSISYEASQKVHNALKWLIETQGVRVGDKVFVLWGIGNEQTPNLLDGTIDLLGLAKEEIDTKTQMAEAFNKAILGYRCQIKQDSCLTLLGVDAATTGRLSVVFQREYRGQQGNELIDRIVHWHKTCCWHMHYKKESGDYIHYEGAPAPIHIARAAYGTDQNGLLKGNDKVFAQAVERILPCICDGQKIPKDLVDTVLQKAKFPQNYGSQSLWLNIVAIACALYRKYLYDYKKEEISMNVKDTDDMAYNCGRLLAIADAIESWALREKSEDKKATRMTNAMRYYTRFVHHPAETWVLINEKLLPYKNQLGGKAGNLNRLLGEVSGKLDPKKMRELSNLDGGFVLGFDSQRQDIIDHAMERKSKKSVTESDSLEREEQ